MASTPGKTVPTRRPPIDDDSTDMFAGGMAHQVQYDACVALWERMHTDRIDEMDWTSDVCGDEAILYEFRFAQHCGPVTLANHTLQGWADALTLAMEEDARPRTASCAYRGPFAFAGITCDGLETEDVLFDFTLSHVEVTAAPTPFRMRGTLTGVRKAISVPDGFRPGDDTPYDLPGIAGLPSSGGVVVVTPSPPGEDRETVTVRLYASADADARPLRTYRVMGLALLDLGEIGKHHREYRHMLLDDDDDDDSDDDDTSNSASSLAYLSDDDDDEDEDGSG